MSFKTLVKTLNTSFIFFQEPTSGNTIVHEIIDVSERKQFKYIKSSEEVKLWNDALCQVCSMRHISLVI